MWSWEETVSAGLPAILEPGGTARDLVGVALPATRVLRGTTKPVQPYGLHDAAGAVVVPVATFFAELLDRSRQGPVPDGLEAGKHTESASGPLSPRRTHPCPVPAVCIVKPQFTGPV